VRVSVPGVPALALVLLSLCAAAPSFAQAPPLPVPGFMPPYEITRIVRASGFDPLAPPLREGTTYVLRATDFRGILMRVVVDAHSGAIRAVNRIVPPDYPGPIGMVPPYGTPTYGMQPYGPPPYGRPPYGALPPDGLPDSAGHAIPPAQANGGPFGQPAPNFAPRSAAPAANPRLPPLPRPRPIGLAEQHTGDDATASAKSTPASAAPAAKFDAGPGTASAVTPTSPSAQAKPAPAPIND
jgi:hypothetical protein